jgi:hypothetical protein
MPIELDVNLKHELSWNIASSCGLNTQYFHVELLQADDTTPWKHPQWQEFLYIMNLVVKFGRRELARMEDDMTKKIIFSMLWKYNT